MLPEPLVEQLASPGRMFIPVGTESQSVLQVDKDENGNVTKTKLFGVMVSGFRSPGGMNLLNLVQYVPLTDRKAKVRHNLPPFTAEPHSRLRRPFEHAASLRHGVQVVLLFLYVPIVNLFHGLHIHRKKIFEDGEHMRGRSSYCIYSIGTKLSKLVKNLTGKLVRVD